MWVDFRLIHWMTLFRIRIKILKQLWWMDAKQDTDLWTQEQEQIKQLKTTIRRLNRLELEKQEMNRLKHILKKINRLKHATNTFNRLESRNNNILPSEIKNKWTRYVLEFDMEWKWKKKMKSWKTYVVEAREEEYATWKVNRLQDEWRLSLLNQVCSSFEESKPFEGWWKAGCACCCWTVFR